MRNRLIVLLVFLSVISFHYNCSIKWTEAIKKGNTIDISYNKTFKFEELNGLIIIPVAIQGEKYRFLFDTGALSSISKKLQQKYNFKKISQGHIIDSEKNRSKVNYIVIDTLRVQGIPFIAQTAFITDFKKNPIINCMGIDGIFGSNSMRFCNWIIDYHNKEITFSNTSAKMDTMKHVQIPFQTDDQYNILANLQVGKSEIKNITIDYGSNGSISIPDHAFSILEQKQIITQTFTESGMSQSGILGEINLNNRAITYMDSIKSNDLVFYDVEIKSGGSGTLGTQLLSQWVVTIDWKRHKLYFSNHFPNENTTFGFKISIGHDGFPYILSVIENSPAWEKGIRPNMKIAKIDSLDFEMNHNICDYLQFKSQKIDKIDIELVNSDGERRKIALEKDLITSIFLKKN